MEIVKRGRPGKENTNTHQLVLAVQMKNWEPLVLGPALAMDRIPGPVCLRVKFSSANLGKETREGTVKPRGRERGQEKLTSFLTTEL